MNAEAERLRQRVAMLLDPAASPQVQRDVVQAWYAEWLALLGVTDPEISGILDAFATGTWLPHGKAISPLNAARCLCEHRRTAQFLRGMESALREAQRRFPGETIHVLEAGCGPFAPLSLPFAVHYPAEQVRFTLLDIHAASLAGAGELAERLGVSGSIERRLCADATTVRFREEERPHVIACEVMQRALANEPQVAATLNLAPQLRPGGLLVPERIEVAAGLFNAAARTQTLLGRAGMTDETASRVGAGRSGVMVLEAAGPGAVGVEAWRRAQVVVPPHDRAREALHLFTRIEVHGGHWLEDFDCSLNLPMKLALPERADRGGTIALEYVMQGTPGFRVTAVSD